MSTQGPQAGTLARTLAIPTLVYSWGFEVGFSEYDLPGD
jgi:hypothetical protein